MKMPVVLVALLTISPCAIASETDGNALLRQCTGAVSLGDKLSRGENVETTSSVMAWGSAQCLGLMHGITMTHFVYRELGRQPLACLPKDGMTAGQAARVVVKYLNENPEQLHEEAFVLATKAIITAFPCADQKVK